MKSLRWMSVLLFALLFTAIARTQVTGGMWTRSSLSLVPIKGSPFSADVVDETNQVLSDGNRIHRETHGKMFRDSDGRTRTEVDLGIPGSEPRFMNIFIMDPVKQVNIIINPLSKTATINHMRQTIQQNPRTADARPARPGAAAGILTPGGLGVGIPAAPGPGAEETIRRLLEGEDLGIKEIEGFPCKGARHTYTTPAGQLGNERPIVSTTETWFSPDLREVLLIKTESPMSGQYTKKLVNIQVSEPDPALFQVPVDYTVKDEPAQR